MKKIAVLFLICLSVFFITGCVNDFWIFETKDSRITGHTFREVNISDAYMDITEEQAEEFDDVFVTENGDYVCHIKVVETIYLTFNKDKTAVYKIIYNPEFLKLSNRKNYYAEGTYKIHGKKILMDFEGNIDLSRDFKYLFNEDNQLEMHIGFLDQTLFLRMDCIE